MGHRFSTGKMQMFTIRWEGSDADRWLRVDIASKKHLEMKPELLFATRPCYQPFGKKRFAKRIDQIVESAKPFGATPGQSKSKRGKKLPTGLAEKSRKTLLAEGYDNTKQETLRTAYI